jgi:hypothetical protein
MSHLGDLSTVLADDEHGTWVDLSLDVRLRALAHVADCPSCRAEVDEQRRVKARVRLAAGAPTVQAMPAGLLDSLLRLPASPQRPPVSGRPAQLVPSAGTTIRRGRYVAAAGIAASVVVGLGGAGFGGAGAAVPGGASAGPVGAPPSAPASTSGPGASQTVPVGFGASTTAPVTRLFAGSAQTALSVVYRRP